LREKARFFKVLADEARLQMLWLLLNHRELCVCDIMAVLEITQSKASRHLAALRNAGLAVDRKEGLWSYYSLRKSGDRDINAQLKLLRASLSERPDAERLLKKLNAWLRAKKSSESCLKSGSLVRAIKTAKSGSIQMRPDRGAR
jgi:ArsR family transcriptional regulator